MLVALSKAAGDGLDGAGAADRTKRLEGMEHSGPVRIVEHRLRSRPDVLQHGLHGVVDVHVPEQRPQGRQVPRIAQLTQAGYRSLAPVVVRVIQPG